MKNDAMRRRAGGVKLSSIIFCVTTGGLAACEGAVSSHAPSHIDGQSKEEVENHELKGM
jgi:hypothetical protein